MSKTIKLSIIIPAYNAEPYLGELVTCLEAQMPAAGVEVIIVDDGSRQQVSFKGKGIKVIRQDNQGAGSARNTGIDKAKGDYISFIDADDLVSGSFIETILEKTKDEPDVIELSWKSLTPGYWNCDQHLRSEGDRLPNPSVCTRVFKRSFIGDVRFNTQKDSTEDEDFCRKMGYLDPDKEFKRAVITDYMYFYRDTVPMSKSKKYAAGILNTKRVVYYYRHVTKEMTWLLDEIIKEDEINEVILLTDQCDIPELKRYCQIKKPCQMWGHVVRGEHYPGLTLRRPPLRTQVIIYRKNIYKIGGMSSFINNFIDQMADRYDITILTEAIDETRYKEFTKRVRVVANRILYTDRHGNISRKDLQPGAAHRDIYCDSLIVLSFLDPLPGNVHADKVVRMCHACRTDSSWEIPKDYDHLIYVSGTAAKSFGVKDGLVIHNFINPPKDKALILVSATRFPAPDKGDIERRMRALANMLNDKGISYVWLNFADGHMTDPPKNFYNMGTSSDMQRIIKAADYLVQLSDSECWSYSCLEALTSGTAVICTPFPSAFEMGIIDGVNAHVIPFDMDYDVTKLLEVPEFTYTYDNDEIKEQWVEVLGNTIPRHDYDPREVVRAKVVRPYYSRILERDMSFGEIVYMTQDRAEELRAGGYIIIGG